MSTRPVTRLVSSLLLSVSKGTKYERAWYEHPEHGPFAATSEKVFVSKLSWVDTLDALQKGIVSNTRLPISRDVWNTFSTLDIGEEEVSVTNRTPPNPDLFEQGLQILCANDAKAREELHNAEVRLQTSTRGEKKADLRDLVVALRQEARTAARKLKNHDYVFCHALRIGKAAVDLRLVRKALYALNVHTGTLRGGKHLQPVLLKTTKGIAVIASVRLT